MLLLDCVSYQRNTVIEAADKKQVVTFPDGTEVTQTKKWKEVSVDLSLLIILYILLSQEFCQQRCKKENCLTPEIDFNTG